MTDRLRLCFMGTPDFAVPTLAALVKAGHNVVCVYSQPPRPAGRGHHLQKSPVHTLADSLGIEVRTPVSLKGADEQRAFADLQLDAAVVVAYGLLLPQAVIDAPRLATLNIHASLLPRWRGAAPIQRAILAGDTETGNTIMRVQLKLDAGPMLMVEKLPLDRTTTASGLHDALSELGAKMIVPALEKLSAGQLIDVIQPEGGVTYAAKLEKDEGQIRWTDSADLLDRKIRALNPWPGVWCQYNGERIKILAATPVDKSGNPGQVVGAPLLVACGDGALNVTKVQRAGKAPMGVDELLRGFSIPVGSIFT